MMRINFITKHLQTRLFGPPSSADEGIFPDKPMLTPFHFPYKLLWFHSLITRCSTPQTVLTFDSFSGILLLFAWTGREASTQSGVIHFTFLLALTNGPLSLWLKKIPSDRMMYFLSTTDGEHDSWPDEIIYFSGFEHYWNIWYKAHISNKSLNNGLLISRHFKWHYVFNVVASCPLLWWFNGAAWRISSTCCGAKVIQFGAPRAVWLCALCLQWKVRSLVPENKRQTCSHRCNVERMVADFLDVRTEWGVCENTFKFIFFSSWIPTSFCHSF